MDFELSCYKIHSVLSDPRRIKRPLPWISACEECPVPTRRIIYPLYRSQSQKERRSSRNSSDVDNSDDSDWSVDDDYKDCYDFYDEYGDEYEDDDKKENLKFSYGGSQFYGGSLPLPSSLNDNDDTNGGMDGDDVDNDDDNNNNNKVRDFAPYYGDETDVFRRLHTIIFSPDKRRFVGFIPGKVITIDLDRNGRIPVFTYLPPFSLLSFLPPLPTRR